MPLHPCLVRLPLLIFLALAGLRTATAQQVAPAEPDALQRAIEAFELDRPAEALAELDRHLIDRPGSTAALDLLRTHRASFRLEALADLHAADEALADLEDPIQARAALERAARRVGPLPPSSRMLSLLEFDDFVFVHLPSPFRDEIRAAWLVDRDPKRRRLSAEWIRQSPPLEDAAAARALVVRSLVDTSESVRVASASSLASFEDPGLVAPLVRAMELGQPVLREHAVSALGYAGYQVAVPALFAALLAPPPPVPASGGTGAYVQIGRQSAYVQDFDVEVATGAAIADPVIGVISDGSVLGARVLAINRERTTGRLRQSLERLIGRPIGKDPGQWQASWDRERGQFERELERAARPRYRRIPPPVLGR